MAKYRVMNHEGQQIAQYDHESELRTFLKASYPDIDHGKGQIPNGVHEIRHPETDDLVATVSVSGVTKEPANANQRGQSRADSGNPVGGSNVPERNPGNGTSDVSGQSGDNQQHTGG